MQRETTFPKIEQPDVGENGCESFRYLGDNPIRAYCALEPDGHTRHEWRSRKGHKVFWTEVWLDEGKIDLGLDDAGS